MTDYTVLKHLLDDLAASTSPAEIRSNSKAVDDHILELAEAIKARPPKKVVQNKEPLLVRFGDDVRITVWRGNQGKIFSRQINGLYIYKTNEPSEMADEKIEPNPGKDGYTWFMKNYGLDSKVLEPHEGPILHALLATAKAS
jgi:hypothetical protein